MKNSSEKVPSKEYWKNEKAKKMWLQDWGSANDNFGGYCEGIGWKASLGWFPRSRGDPSNRKLEAAIRTIVEDFVNDPLVKGFGPTLMAEKLEEIKEIRLSKDSPRKMMISAGVWKSAYPARSGGKIQANCDCLFQIRADKSLATCL